MGKIIEYLADNLVKISVISACSITVIYLGKIWFSYSYFKKKGIKTPKYSFFLGNFPQLKKNQQDSDNIRKWTQELGKTYGYYQGHTPVLVTSDLDIIQEVFIKQYPHFSAKRKRAMDPPDGTEFHHMISSVKSQWKRLRTITNPVFSSAKLKHMSWKISRCADKLAKKLASYENSEIDVMRILKNFTMDTIWNCSFSTDMDFQNDKEAARIVDLSDSAFVSFRDFTPLMYLATYFSEFRNIISISYLIFNFILFKLNPNIPIINPMFRISQESAKIVQFRLQNKLKENDYLQTLLDSCSNKKIDFKTKDKEYLDPHTDFKVEKSLSPKELKMSLSLFILAGYETTSTTLGLIMRNLALMPEEQQKIVNELFDAFPDESTQLDANNIQSLEYMDMFIKETLRMTPIATAAMNRRCVKKSNVCGIEIDEGVMVVIDVLSIHYDPDLWGPVDPNTFYPLRFSPEFKRSPYAFLSFGIGPRNCIGLKFAMTEMKIALAKILRHHVIAECDSTPKVYRYVEGIVRSMVDPVKVLVKKRTVA